MRYAIYYCPPAASPLARLGHDWLATAGGVGLPGLSLERRDVLLASVRRYGWHATIRAPFTPRPGATDKEIGRAVVALAQTITAFTLNLKLAHLAGFLCLRPCTDGGPERTLAATCLEVLKPLCKPLAEAALQQRRGGLDAQELRLLQAHGYPYVLDRYRFHLSLSAPATAFEEQSMRKWLEPRVVALPPLKIDAVSICREAAPGSVFEIIERVPLYAAGAEHSP